MENEIELCYFRLEENIENYEISKETSKNLSKTDFNFSDKYRISYKNKRLKIIKNENYIPNFYNLKENGNISNITAIIGKNGSGKSVLLHLLTQILFTNHYKNYNFILVLKHENKFKIYLEKELAKNIQIECEEKPKIISYEQRETADSICESVMNEITTIYFSNVLNIRNRQILSSKFNNHFINVSLEEAIYKKYGDTQRLLNRGIINEKYVDERFLYVKNIQEAKKEMTIRNLVYLNEDRLFNFENLTMVPKCYNQMEIFESSLDKLRYFRKKIDDKNEKLVGHLEIEPSDKEKQIYEKLLEKIINTKDKEKVIYTVQFILIDQFFEELYNEMNTNLIIAYMKEILNEIQDDEPEKMFLSFLDKIIKLNQNKLRAICQKTYRTETINSWMDKWNQFFTGINKKYIKTIENLKKIIDANETEIICNELFSTESKFEEDTILKSFIPVILLSKKQIKMFCDIVKHDKNLLNMFNIEFKGLSSGEQALLNLYSSFYAAIHNDKIGTNKNLLIILDEPDLYFHPEWQRKLIYLIIKFFNTNYADRNIQIIFTSNSPYVLSDLKKDSVITLGKQESERTFAGNILYLLLDKYFMDDTIGAFSEEKIRNLIGKIKNKDITADDIKMIDEIGENLIRNNINEMRDKYDKN